MPGYYSEEREEVHAVGKEGKEICLGDISNDEEQIIKPETSH